MKSSMSWMRMSMRLRMRLSCMSSRAWFCGGGLSDAGCGCDDGCRLASRGSMGCLCRSGKV